MIAGVCTREFTSILILVLGGGSARKSPFHQQSDLVPGVPSCPSPAAFGSHFNVFVESRVSQALLLRVRHLLRYQRRRLFASIIVASTM